MDFGVNKAAPTGALEGLPVVGVIGQALRHQQPHGGIECHAAVTAPDLNALGHGMSALLIGGPPVHDTVIL